MRLLSISTIILILAPALVLSGCDSRPVVKSELAFAVGGIGPGLSKSVLERTHKLLPCTPATKGLAECLVDDLGARYDFFGAEASAIKLKLPEPYSTVVSVDFVTKGAPVNSQTVEASWRIKGRCLTKTAVDAAVKFDPDSVAPFVRHLNEVSLLPTRDGDFVCLKEDGTFFQYTPTTDKASALATAFYLNETLARNFEYIFSAIAAMTSAQAEINGQLNAEKRIVVKTPVPGNCSRYEEGNPLAQANKLALAKQLSEHVEFLDKYQSSFMFSLCNGDGPDAMALISNGYLSFDDARAISTALGYSGELPRAAAKADEMQTVKAKLMGLGVCNACADNAAHLYVKVPSGQCAKVVVSALAGNIEAIETLNGWPAYCKAY